MTSPEGNEPSARAIRRLQREDAAASARLHREALGAEFLARCGQGFLRQYHRAWLVSPAGVALAAIDERGELVGVLLGALEPRAHYRSMLRRHGPSLALRLLARAAVRAGFARALVATRALRYTRGVVVALTPAGGRAPPSRVGEVAHLMTRADARGRGVGRALLEEAVRLCREAGLDEIELVTPLGDDARTFYERLGWRYAGEVTSRSGELFVRYRLPLGP